MTPPDPRATLDALLAATDDAVLTVDLDGRISGWNRSAERLFGYPEAQILGTSVGRLFPAHLREEVAGWLASVAAGAHLHHFETEIQRRDGMPTPISLSAQAVLGDGEAVVAALVIARDITEQRLAQSALAEVEARVRESEALAHVGGWLWDVRTGAVQWTDELHRIHGIDPLDFEGTLEAHLACIGADDRDRVRQAMQGSVASGLPFEEEYHVVRPDGSTRWLSVRAVPTLSSAGSVVGLRGIAHDLTTGLGRTAT